MKLALQQRGIDPQNVIACGDGPNDIPMFDTVGWSVSIDNRFQEVVDASDYNTKNNGKKGTIEFIEKLITILE